MTSDSCGLIIVLRALLGHGVVAYMKGWAKSWNMSGSAPAAESAFSLQGKMSPDCRLDSQLVPAGDVVVKAASRGTTGWPAPIIPLHRLLQHILGGDSTLGPGTLPSLASSLSLSLLASSPFSLHIKKPHLFFCLNYLLYSEFVHSKNSWFIRFSLFTDQEVSLKNPYFQYFSKKKSEVLTTEILYCYMVAAPLKMAWRPNLS